MKTEIKKQDKFTRILERTKDGWRGKATIEVKQRRGAIELAASKKRKQAW